MRKIHLFAVAAAGALILAATGGWLGSTGQARVVAPTSVQIDPFETMVHAKDLPAVRHFDYTLIWP
jgi:hypothetical protein